MILMWIFCFEIRANAHEDDLSKNPECILNGWETQLYGVIYNLYKLLGITSRYAMDKYFQQVIYCILVNNETTDRYV
jgi:hypothetical protein